MDLHQKVLLESERVMNLVRGFGWEKIKEEVLNGDLAITLKKHVVDTDENVLAAAPQ